MKRERSNAPGESEAAPAQPSARPGPLPQALQTVLAAAAAVTLVWLAWLNVQDDSVAHRTLAVAMDGKAQDTARGYRPYDVDMPRLAGNGNLFFRFAGFDESTGGFINDTYYRTVYSLYPRRVYAARPTDVVNHFTGILQSDFRPDANWLVEHHIGSAVLFELTPDRQIRVSVQSLRPPAGAPRATP